MKPAVHWSLEFKGAFLVGIPLPHIFLHSHAKKKKSRGICCCKRPTKLGRMARELNAKARKLCRASNHNDRHVCSPHLCKHTHTPQDAGNRRKETQVCRCWAQTPGTRSTGLEGSDQPEKVLFLLWSHWRTLAALELALDCTTYPSVSWSTYIMVMKEGCTKWRQARPNWISTVIPIPGNRCVRQRVSVSKSYSWAWLGWNNTGGWGQLISPLLAPVSQQGQLLHVGWNEMTQLSVPGVSKNHAHM
jgi:hypothetical protein